MVKILYSFPICISGSMDSDGIFYEIFCACDSAGSNFYFGYESVTHKVKVQFSTSHTKLRMNITPGLSC